MKRILIVDDERDILDLLQYNLKKEGYEVLTAKTGTEAIRAAAQAPHLILLDVMLPEMDGWEVLRQLKREQTTQNIPVIFLTARGTDIDEVLGLELGADDYIVKPISIPKLIARVKSVLRKQEAVESPRQKIKSVAVGAVEILPSQHLVLVQKKEIFFPRKEFEVLLFLASRQGEVVDREKLLNAIWGTDVRVVDRTVDVHIRKIREKLGKFADYIETIKGIGYRMREL